MVLGITFNNGSYPISKPTHSFMMNSNLYQYFWHIYWTTFFHDIDKFRNIFVCYDKKTSG